jgi:hypothetical protein
LFAVTGTSALADSLVVTKNALGTTNTRAITATNTTVSGSQVSPLIGGTVFHSGGTQQNWGIQRETQSSSSRSLVRYLHGTGSGAPTSTQFYFDSEDNNLPVGLFANSYAVFEGGGGYRFNRTNQRGGFDADTGDNWLRIRVFNSCGFRLITSTSTDGSSSVNRLTVSQPGTITWTQADSTHELIQGPTAGERIEYRAHANISTTNNTSVNVLSYSSLTQSFVGEVIMHVAAADATTGDAAVYEKRYQIKQHNSGGITVTSIGTDIELESDASWQARVVTSAGNLHLEWTGDATNQVYGAAWWIIRLRTYTAS